MQNISLYLMNSKMLKKNTSKEILSTVLAGPHVSHFVLHTSSYEIEMATCPVVFPRFIVATCHNYVHETWGWCPH